MRIRFALAAALSLAPFAAFPQDAAPGRNLAASCAICHGTEGRSATREAIALAGLPREHLVEQMKAFRDGKRPATVMHQIAKGYNDAQIGLLADYFAAQKK